MRSYAMKPLLHQKLYYLLFALFMTGIAWWLMGRETTEPLAAFKDEASATGEKPEALLLKKIKEHSPKYFLRYLSMHKNSEYRRDELL